MALSKIDPDGLNVGQIGGRRNLIINGAMQVAQRGTSATNPGGGYDCLDRWRQSQHSGGLGNFTIEQSSDAPDGFATSMKLTKSGTTSQGAPDAAYMQHFFEGQNVQHLQYGGSNAKKVTLSFYVKSSLTGTWGVALLNGESSRYNVQTYTISSANTWEYKTVTFDGDTAAGIDNDNSAELDVQFILGAGTDYQTSTINTWTSGNKKTTSSQTQWPETDGATWQITGVQLEVGDTATPFEHRSYDEELALCQRYYHRIISTQTQNQICVLAAYQATSFFGVTQFPVTMRASPTSTNSGNTDFKVWGNNSSQATTAVSGANTVGTQSAEIYCTTASGTQGYAYWLRGTSTSSFIDYDAEL